jgi:hypothetical protein
VNHEYVPVIVEMPVYLGYQLIGGERAVYQAKERARFGFEPQVTGSDF